MQVGRLDSHGGGAGKQIVKDLYDLVVIQRDTFLVRAEQAESRVAVLEAMVAAKGGEA